jgi:molybdopterin-guanine dinucleotide biosynthesis protein
MGLGPCPTLILTGPRRSGKTTLLRNLFARAAGYLLEDPDLVARVSADPHTFLEDIRGPAILVVEHPGSDRPDRPGSTLFRKFR